MPYRCHVLSAFCWSFALLTTRATAQSLPAGEGPPRAQVLGDAVYGTRAMWRGTPRVSYPVVVVDTWVALNVLGGSLSAGYWTLLQSRDANAGDYAVAAPGHDQAEVDWSLQYARRTVGLDLTGGVANYRLRNAQSFGALPPTFQTTELFTTIAIREGALRRLGFTPSLSAFVDVDQVKGTYLEGELTYAMPLLPFERPIGVVHLSVRTGMSLGQSTDGGAAGYFDRDGFTHLETLATFTGQVASWLGLGFTWHQSFGIDPATKRSDPRSPVAQRSSWGWIETWLSARLPGRAW